MARFQIGGQAVLEGVMVRGKSHWVVAVRKPDQRIILEERRLNSLSNRFPFLRFFILRGGLVLIEALTLGVQALAFSVQEATEEEVQITSKEMAFSVTLAVLLGIGLFIVLPAWLSALVSDYLQSSLAVNLLEGGLRIVIFVAYLLAISRMHDIRRVFQYHGAEHKVIHAYEAGEELTPEAASKYSPLHLACGTSFILIVLVVLILIFAFLGRQPLLMRVLSRLAVVPLVAGLSYEIIRLARNHRDSRFVQALMAPGLMLQKMTTLEPSLDQLEVAIASLGRLLILEGVRDEDEVETLP